MTAFYLWPDRAVIALCMMMAAILILQAICVTLGWRRLRTDGRGIVEGLLESVVLLWLLSCCWLVAEVQYYAKDGFVYPGGWVLQRWIFFGLLVVLAAAATVLDLPVRTRRQPEDGRKGALERLLLPLSAPLIALPVLPVFEAVGGIGFVWGFTIGVLLWLTRAICLCVLRSRELGESITGASVKEAVDALPTGVMFCEPDGTIVLRNRRMRELMAVLTGTRSRNGRRFLERLSAGEVQPGCVREEMGDSLAYRLPDDAVWVFARKELSVGKKQYIQLTASDMTERVNAARALLEQNRELELRAQELRHMLDNLSEICRAEETMRVKSRVHDLLGQRISLLLRALREHREPDESLLLPFADNLLAELERDAARPAALTLETLIREFRSMGVELRVHGSLPKEETHARAFVEIVAECTTNAVRHGCASEIDVTFAPPDSRTMIVTDNGLAPDVPMREGGGLRGMRHRAEKLGGSLRVDFTARFTVTVTLPDGLPRPCEDAGEENCDDESTVG